MADMRALRRSLGRMSEGTPERAPHAFWIAEAALARNEFETVRGRFKHQSGCFHPQPLNGLGRRYPGVFPEHSSELPRTQLCNLSQHRYGQCVLEVFLRKGNRRLDAIRAGSHLGQRGELRRAVSALMVKQEFSPNVIANLAKPRSCSTAAGARSIPAYL